MQLDDLIKIRDTFLKEMHDADAGTATSIPFIKHQLSSTPLVGDGEVFQVLVIGGSIFKTATMMRKEGALVPLTFDEGTLEPFHTEDQFLKFIERKIASDVTVVAINFAYALKPIFSGDTLDGIFLVGSKEYEFKGMVGKQVGVEIATYIEHKYHKKLKVAIANDTICLLLAGLGTYHWTNFACGIVGTGLNFAMFSDEHTAVNLESGEFKHLELSNSGKMIDATSEHPGAALMEKEVSGAYLYKHYNELIKERQLMFEAVTSTEELNQVAENSANPGNAVALEVLDRSAALTAVQVSAILEYHKADTTFSMVGSLFWKGYTYRDMVEKYVQQLTPEHKAEFVTIDNAEMLGTAKLICSV